MKKIIFVLLALTVLLIPENYSLAQPANAYVYKENQGEAASTDGTETTSEEAQNSYVYEENSDVTNDIKSEEVEETTSKAKESNEETFADLGKEFLENNKVNMAVFMVLIIALGVVIQKNKVLRSDRRR